MREDFAVDTISVVFETITKKIKYFRHLVDSAVFFEKMIIRLKINK